MTTFPRSPKTLKGGIMLIDPDSMAVLRVIEFQYNPDTLSRTLQAKGVGENGDRSEALRLKGPPVETFKLDVEIDATDQLEFPTQNPAVTEFGIFPQLAALETIIYPTTAQLQANNEMALTGTLEIVPMETPLALFVWSKSRIVPVRITEFSVTEEAFDVNLNPIRAKVSLSMRVLSVDDLGFDHKGGNLYMTYQKHKEDLSFMAGTGALSILGKGGI